MGEYQECESRSDCDAARDLSKARAEIEHLRATLESIRDAKEPRDNRADDDADWRFVALEMKRCATVALGNVEQEGDKS
jgi:hypothetical protein